MEWPAGGYSGWGVENHRSRFGDNAFRLFLSLLAAVKHFDAWIAGPNFDISRGGGCTYVFFGIEYNLL